MSAAENRRSRLERTIDRFVAQRAFLDHAARLIASRPGPVIEIGLGKGRTYDHLRRLLPGREIFAFDHHVHAPAECVPDDDHLSLGDFRDSLARAADRLRGQAALAHADTGSENRDRDARLAAAIAPLIDALMAEGGIVVSDRAMDVARWTRLPPPGDAGPWPYYLYRVAAR